MCGIVGYVGRRDALPILLDGLKRLEYRGYDSAGVALINDGRLVLKKRSGKVAELAACWNGEAKGATLGIGHTRWATHGVPNDINAHPHYDCKDAIAVIHNGVIENCAALKKSLQGKGHRFISDTDTEVLAHLIEVFFEDSADLDTAVRQALAQVEGTYGLVVLSRYEPGKLIAARKGSPLVVGHGDGEFLVASDASAIIEHTRRVTYLDDGEVAVITVDGVTTKTLDATATTKRIEELTFDLEKIGKGGFPHFMLKEIYEQPETLANAMRGRLLDETGTAKLAGLDGTLDKLRLASRMIFTACGTSWHSALIGKYMLEQYTHKPVEVEYASEFRYRNPTVTDEDVIFSVSQSGETADTLGAMREARRRGATVLGIVNTVGSTIARESDGGVYIHAGPEIGVASTKAFTSQLTVLTLITLLLARKNGMSREQGVRIVRELKLLPEKIGAMLADTSEIESIAAEFKDAHNFLYLGRGYNFPVALEGALKLKEISYIHAEGYPAAEMKHGPIALIDESMPVVCIASKDSTYEKILSNIEEVRARGGRVIAIVNEVDDQIRKLAAHIIRVPKTLDLLSPIVNSIPLQLLAYHIAVLRGCDVDRPRNLAKSVTVE